VGRTSCLARTCTLSSRELRLASSIPSRIRGGELAEAQAIYTVRTGSPPNLAARRPLLRTADLPSGEDKLEQREI